MKKLILHTLLLEAEVLAALLTYLSASTLEELFWLDVDWWAQTHLSSNLEFQVSMPKIIF